MFPKRHMRSMGPHGVLHEKHVRLIKKAVQKCFDGMPATAHPHDGDVDKAFIHLIPILKEVFTIPTMSAGVDVLYREHLLKILSRPTSMRWNRTKNCSKNGLMRWKPSVRRMVNRVASISPVKETPTR